MITKSHSIKILLCLAFVALPALAQKKRAPVAKRPVVAASSQQFEEAAAKANQAREAGKLDEAITLYKKAISFSPKWSEGWWYLATLLYEKDQYPEAVKAFNNAAALNPKTGAPISMMALCEFRLGDYDNALAHLIQGRTIGIGDNPELKKVLRFHEGMLLLLKSEFEMAQKVFDGLSYDNVNTEQLFVATGLSILRIPSLPAQIDLKHPDYQMIRRAGYAQHLVAQLNASDGQREYDRLAADFAKAPGIFYAYGRYLLYQLRNDEAAIPAFQKEIENSPRHALARLQIAYIKIKNKEPQDGVKLAEEGVKLNPRLLLGHYILGRLYLETGENPRAIDELEIAQRMAPDEAKIYFALARAYAKAGRKADADQARQNFTRLNAVAEAAAANGLGRATAIEESEEKPKP